MKPSKEFVYRKVARTIENKNLVKGSTVINHNIRAYLQLTLREYVLLDFLYNWHLINKKSVTYGALWVGTAMYPRYIDRMYQRLKDKGLLFMDVDGRVKTTSAWNDYFKQDDKFEELWKMHKVGSKAKAKAAYMKAVKVDSHDNIKAGLLKYKEYLVKTEQYPAHLSSFLNYRNKQWLDEFNADLYQKKKSGITQPQKATTGPKSAL